jgi:NAD dependent epimerase/dehydratase family enzyme
MGEGPEDMDALINLAGRSVNCRYNGGNRREILESRVRSTEVLGEAIRGLAQPPKLWMNASTATIYRHSFDRAMDIHSCAGSPYPIPQASRNARMLSVATFLHRTESELLLKSRRVVPGRLEEHGFQFEFPRWPEAARDLVRRVRETSEHAKSKERIQKRLEEARERTT